MRPFPAMYARGTVSAPFRGTAFGHFWTAQRRLFNAAKPSFAEVVSTAGALPAKGYTVIVRLDGKWTTTLLSIKPMDVDRTDYGKL